MLSHSHLFFSRYEKKVDFFVFKKVNKRLFSVLSIHWPDNSQLSNQLKIENRQQSNQNKQKLKIEDRMSSNQKDKSQKKDFGSQIMEEQVASLL